MGRPIVLRTGIFLFCAFILLLLCLCYQLPFSKPYKFMHDYGSLYKLALEASVHRSKEGMRYFQHLDKTQSSNEYLDRLRSDNLNIALGIITMRRANEETQELPPGAIDYLVQSASLVDKVMRQNAFFKTSVPFICNIDMNPNSYELARKLYTYLPYTERYGSNSLGVPNLSIPTPGVEKYFKDFEANESRYHKEMYDYSFCLQSAASLRPQYVILLEDDVLLHKDFPHVLEHLLNNRVSLTQKNNHISDIVYLKMYYPPKWQGFGMEITRLLDLFSLGVVGASIIVLAMCLVLQFQLTYKNVFYRAELQKAFHVSFLLVLLTCWFVGRQNVNELRRMSKHLYRTQGSGSCCTQAMLYPVSEVDPLVQHIVSSPSKHKDLLIMDYAAGRTAPALQVEPNLCYHVGLISTLIMPEKHPEEIVFGLNNF